MKKKSYLTLDDEFIRYCELNNVQDIEKLAKETFNRGFTILKYGEIPNTLTEGKIKTNIKKYKGKVATEPPPPPKPKNTETIKKDLYDE